MRMSTQVYIPVQARHDACNPQVHGPPTLYDTKRPGPFQALAKIIVYQQLAGAAASTIWKRVVNLATKHLAAAKSEDDAEDDASRLERLVPLVSPDAILRLSEEELREAGLSQRKASESISYSSTSHHPTPRYKPPTSSP